MDTRGGGGGNPRNPETFENFKNYFFYKSRGGRGGGGGAEHPKARTFVQFSIQISLKSGILQCKKSKKFSLYTLLHYTESCILSRARSDNENPLKLVQTIY